MSNFKPQLLPNNEVGSSPDWEERIEHPTHWLYSNKLDGARVELFSDGTVKGRSLKVIPNVHIQQMGRDIMDSMPEFHPDSIIEAEFYSPEMNFSEIMHFFKTEDVTSEKSKEKYYKLWSKTGGNPDEGWPYPGRDVKWLTTWHKSLKFYAFDVVNVQSPEVVKAIRTLGLDRYVTMHTKGYHSLEPYMVMIQQVPFTHIDELYQAYDQAIMDGCEGVVVIHKSSSYKYGRHTLNSKQAFKIKDDNLEFDGQIIDVLEATEAREGAEKTVNELGRSVTSKLQEDRVPSGMAKGFFVQMEDGNKLTVSLTGYDHPARRELLERADEYIGLWIKFTGMNPVKDGGCPRHAHFTKGNFRDGK